MKQEAHEKAEPQLVKEPKIDVEEYVTARRKLGRLFVSNEFKTKVINTTNAAEREQLFNEDLNAFMPEQGKEILTKFATKRYAIMYAVLERGGIENVIRSRWLSKVAKQVGENAKNTLLLRDTCTREMYLYEQMLVHNHRVSPQSWAQVMNMTSRSQ